MLIKSQDGKMLVMFNVNSISIQKYNTRESVAKYSGILSSKDDRWEIVYHNDEQREWLGVYLTEAQAKEVLDEIMVDFGYDYKTFTMPQDKGADYENKR